MAGSSPVEAKLMRLCRLLQERRFVESRAETAARLVTLAENWNVSYVCGHAQRRRGDIPAAHDVRERLEQVLRCFSRSNTLRGFRHIAERQVPKAISPIREIQHGNARH